MDCSEPNRQRADSSPITCRAVWESVERQQLPSAWNGVIHSVEAERIETRIRENREMDYDDGLIAATDDSLVIRRYIALLQQKRIPYSDIHTVEQIPIGQVRRWRLWGTTIPGYWFNLDPGRRTSQSAS
jgi:hypothetical protein